MSRLIKRVSAEFAEMGYDGQWGEDPTDAKFLGEEGMDPPAGDCWQVWQDVSDETPISPVFATAEECAEWVARTHNASPAAAAAFVEQGWAPSFIVTGMGVFSGVQMAADLESHLAHIAPEGSTPAGSRVRHLDHGTLGAIRFRMPSPNDEYYAVAWDSPLPTLGPADPDAITACRHDGFEVVPS